MPVLSLLLKNRFRAANEVRGSRRPVVVAQAESMYCQLHERQCRVGPGPPQAIGRRAGSVGAQEMRLGLLHSFLIIGEVPILEIRKKLAHVDRRVGQATRIKIHYGQPARAYPQMLRFEVAVREGRQFLR